MTDLRIGTRGSLLAMWQANFVRASLQERHPGLRVELEIVRTKGDKVLDVPLARIGGTGLFTKEIESRLLDGSVDLAVHSLKDLPVELPQGLVLAAVPARQDPADALVARDGMTLADLPTGGRVLTGSLRRQAQLLGRRPDLVVSSVRGNVETRLGKFGESDACAIMFARAGLARLGLLDHVTERLDPADFLPACGQGALAVEVRADDDRTAGLCASLDHAESRLTTAAERAFLAGLGGGCQVPVGAYARHGEESGSLTITGMVADLQGSHSVRRTLTAPVGGPEAALALGERLAELVRLDGGQAILDEIAESGPPSAEAAP